MIKHLMIRIPPAWENNWGPLLTFWFTLSFLQYNRVSFLLLLVILKRKNYVFMEIEQPMLSNGVERLPIKRRVHSLLEILVVTAT